MYAATTETIYRVARNLVAEAKFAARVHLTSFDKRPILANCNVSRIANRDDFASAMAFNAEFRGLFMDVGRQMREGDAWQAFKLAFNHDEAEAQS